MAEEAKDTFTKEQLVRSKKYLGREDLLNALLDADKAYTTDDVDKLINDYLKKEVK